MDLSSRKSRRGGWADADHYLNALGDPWYKLIADLQNVITLSTSSFFAERGLKTLHLPVTTCTISSPIGLGSDSLPVKIDLFGISVYLADSMQFMLEYGCRLHSKGCYYVMPSFRGEAADAMHLSQFYHCEAELPGSVDVAMAEVESYLRHMSAEALRHCGADVERIAGDISHIEQLLSRQGPLPRVTMDEAERIMHGFPEGMEYRPLGFRVLTRAGERRLMEAFGGFVWVVEPDHLAVPFYQAYADADHRTARAADLLFGLGEVVGCGERHASAKDVRLALQRHHVDSNEYEWYITLRERFPMQTSGFGLGTERFLCWLLRHDDVRDCQLLPRFNGEITVP